ncbi:WG repeat-containing protein [Chakrabartyella piscis]|uniref:WG repeat-containing protein n=1 Tax=Chakrabartyella piscis TaxID=2918914 RepID=UPI0029584667|nr:WG repeat-containing protein [Chakrabartyella piscis]
MKKLLQKIVVASIGVSLVLGLSTTTYAKSVYSIDDLLVKELTSEYDYVERYGDIVIIAELVKKEIVYNGETITSSSPIYGLMNIDGKIVIKPQYSDIQNVGEDRFSVLTDENGTYTYGLVNGSGKTLVQPIYSFLGQGSDGLYPVRKSGTTGVAYVNESGTIVIPFSSYNVISGFSEGLALNTDCPYTENTYGYIDTKGNKVIESMYESANSFSEGLAKVQINGKTGFINTSNKLVVSAIYDSFAGAVDSDPRFTNGYCAVVKNGYWGYIDKTGKEVSDFIYTSAGNVSEGIALVSQMVDGTKKYGYIDMKGNEITPCMYINGYDFSCGRALVSNHAMAYYGYIDTTGKVVVDLNLSRGCESYTENVASIVSGSYSMYIGLDGQSVTTCDVKFTDFEEFQEGTAVVTIGSDVSLIRNPILESDYTYEEPKEEVIEEVIEEVVEPTATTDISSESSATITVSPTSAKVQVDGSTIAFEAYTIDGNNYFKLRDVAKALSETDCKFSVGYDSTTRSTTLTSGENYASSGTELLLGDGTQKTATKSSINLYINGNQKKFITYGIDGYGYYKLRDLGDALGFDIAWDSSTSTIQIDTKATTTTTSSNTSTTDTTTNSGYTSFNAFGDLFG